MFSIQTPALLLSESRNYTQILEKRVLLNSAWEQLLSEVGTDGLWNSFQEKIFADKR